MRGADLVVTADLVLMRRGDEVTHRTQRVLGRNAISKDALVTQLLAQVADQQLSPGAD
jgi:hypothetical protein